MTIQTRILERLGWSESAVPLDAWGRVVRGRVEALTGGDAWAYAAVVEEDEAELERLVESLVVRETWFYRDASLFSWLPTFLNEVRRARPGQRIRMLSAPCSSGEEAYSLVMAAVEAGVPLNEIEVVGLDISRVALERAQEALYGRGALRALDERLRDRHFTAEGNRWRLKPELTRAATFHRENLALEQGWRGWGRFDLVLCRNFLIYLSDDAAERVAQSASEVLRVGGVLAMTPCEACGWVPRGTEPVPVPLAAVFLRLAPGAAAKVTPGISHHPHGAARCSHLPTPVSRGGASPHGPIEAVLDMADRGDIGEALSRWEVLAKASEPDARTLCVGAVVHDCAGKATEARALLQRLLDKEANHPVAADLLAALSEPDGDPQTQDRRQAQRRRARTWLRWASASRIDSGSGR